MNIYNLTDRRIRLTDGGTSIVFGIAPKSIARPSVQYSTKGFRIATNPFLDDLEERIETYVTTMKPEIINLPVQYGNTVYIVDKEVALTAKRPDFCYTVETEKGTALVFP